MLSIRVGRLSLTLFDFTVLGFLISWGKPGVGEPQKLLWFWPPDAA